MNRPLRSYLFAPGDNERLLAKMLGAGADAVVVDLEDGVRPERKAVARGVGAQFLRASTDSFIPIYVRINTVGGDLWRDDLAAVVSPALHGVRLAKAESADEIDAVDCELSALEQQAGMPVGATRIVPTIESAAGVLALAQIVLRPRVEALCFGAVDFLADIRAEADAALTASLHALSHLVLASRVAGIWAPVASAHTQLDDEDGLRSTCEVYRRLGFFGRSVIHPKQLAVVHHAFTPTDEDVERARDVVTAFSEQAAAHRGTAVTAGGKFVDEAVVRHARGVLALAESLKVQAKEGSR